MPVPEIPWPTYKPVMLVKVNVELPDAAAALVVVVAVGAKTASLEPVDQLAVVVSQLPLPLLPVPDNKGSQVYCTCANVMLAVVSMLTAAIAFAKRARFLERAKRGTFEMRVF